MNKDVITIKKEFVIVIDKKLYDMNFIFLYNQQTKKSNKKTKNGLCHDDSWLLLDLIEITVYCLWFSGICNIKMHDHVLWIIENSQNI